MKGVKRCLAMFLAVALMLGMVPAEAFATELDEQTETVVENQDETSEEELVVTEVVDEVTPEGTIINEDEIEPLDDSSDDSDICTGVINYIFEDGSSVAQSWSGIFEKGSSYSDDIINPVEQGYEPTAPESIPEGVELTFTTEKISLSFENIQSDFTINVVYKPAIVNYTVEYYLQNVDGEGYTKDTSETYEGLTNSKIDFEPKTYEGFYALLYDEEVKIAADGSTKIEVYYDRYFYLMKFDLDGGYGVEPQYLRYGASVEEVGTPTHPGYTFEGWYADKDYTTKVDIPATMPAENVTYYAKWKAPETSKVTIVYWGENANDEGYSYIDSGIAYVEPGASVDASDVSSIYYCGEETHTHGEECNRTLVCTIPEHKEHTDECLSCKLSEHKEHTSECLICTTQVHTHSDSCCSKEAHTHSLWCYISQCDKEEHTHGEGNCTCTTIEHTHGDSCYKDSLHTHSNSCYGDSLHPHDDSCYSSYSCGLEEHTHTSACAQNKLTIANGTLWTYVKSDTVTVAADGSTVMNVYYDRTQFTLTFMSSTQTGGTGTTYGTITDKWGADIYSRYQTIADSAYGGTYSWATTTNGGGSTGPWTSYFGVMPKESKTYYAHSASGTMTAYYYFESQTAGDYPEATKKSIIAEGSGYNVTAEDRVEFEGFTYDHGTNNGSNYNGAKFYYTRNSYKLTFMNGSEALKTENVKYEAPLSTFASYEPPTTPSYLQAGKYNFAGWYQNPECTGEEYVLDGKTMPANNILLYAKWEPKVYTVNIYQTSEMDTQVGETQKVSYGTNADEVKTTCGNYTFVGWFYMDNGVEKAFDFDSMPITKDMDIYAKWSSNVLVEYVVEFRLQSETGEEVAEAITGSALAGTTKTFDAKVEDELYETYRAGYFPHVSSHSLTLDIEGENKFVFIYTPVEEVEYVIQYLDADTNEPVADSETKTTNKQVVTEKAKVVTGYLADAYQKRLVLSSDASVNILTFYYTKDEEHALVAETHYLVDSNGIETIYSQNTVTGTIGQTYSREAKEIDGYKLSHITVNGAEWSGEGTKELTAEGLHFEFYYTYNRFKVYHQSDKSVDVYDVDKYPEFDLTSVVKEGHLYGGYYEDQTFKTPISNVSGNEITPIAGETYYLKEVPECYICPQLFYAYSPYYNNELKALYYVTAIDDTNYQKVGFDITHYNTETGSVESETESVYEVKANQYVYETITINVYDNAGNYLGNTSPGGVEYFYGNNPSDGYLHLQKYRNELEDGAAINGGEKYSYTPFFVTPDGIKVTGVRTRTVETGNGKFTNWTGEGLKISDKLVDSTTGVYGATTEVPMLLTLRRTYAMNSDGSEKVEYNITKVDGSEVTTQTVEEGNNINKIDYVDKEGYLFAGWYTDKTFKTPADFTNVQEDMTVYAKYISSNAIDIDVMRTGKTSSAVKLRTIVRMNTQEFVEVGFTYSYNEQSETIVADKKSVNYITSIIGSLLKKESKKYEYAADWSLNGLSSGSEFTASPYLVTADGTIVNGETEEYTYSWNTVFER